MGDLNGQTTRAALCNLHVVNLDVLVLGVKQQICNLPRNLNSISSHLKSPTNSAPLQASLLIAIHDANDYRRNEHSN